MSKFVQYKYQGSFNEGDKVCLDIFPGRYESKAGEIVEINNETIGIVSGKSHLSSFPSCPLFNNEGHIEYKVRFENYGIEIWGIPEWVLYPPEE